ncbi:MULTISPECIES: ABC transporter ATP-binding protein [unclassified Leifsonia]|uniref:ABC transporter ATP-binding protein n=1 Tax=unclassified Leifsonia TaxID=2663824 RepID=UPI0006FF630D|nr:MULTISPECIES: ABC transporter ATP-binding protein [unclassified Leifsonia]KQX07693.1 ABC transporter [Leifsonia sp. Root1293]KRA11975.1 ABC transporter [Leifsonia sp. Root60]
MVSLEARSVSRTFSGGAGVKAASIVVAPGEVHALVGLNGAGKTTLMRLMLGMLRASSGSVVIDGVDVASLPSGVWGRVGHVVETPFAYPELDAVTNLRMAAQLKLTDPALIDEMVDAGVAELGLSPFRHVLARRLSQGNKQRLGIAAAVQHHPELIVLDEPTNALDPAGVILVREAILRRRDRGAAVLVSSHHLDEVSRIADRISLMNRGTIIGNLEPGTPDIERAFFAAVLADDELSA